MPIKIMHSMEDIEKHSKSSFVFMVVLILLILTAFSRISFSVKINDSSPVAQEKKEEEKVPYKTGERKWNPETERYEDF